MFKPTPTGELRHRVTIQQYTTTKDGHGQPVKSYTDLATVWADFLSKSSREFYAEQQVNTDLSAIIVMRYRSDVSEKDRITHNGRTYEVFGQPINVDMRNIELHINVKEIT